MTPNKPSSQEAPGGGDPPGHNLNPNPNPDIDIDLDPSRPPAATRPPLTPGQPLPQPPLWPSNKPWPPPAPPQWPSNVPWPPVVPDFPHPDQTLPPTVPVPPDFGEIDNTLPGGPGLVFPGNELPPNFPELDPLAGILCIAYVLAGGVIVVKPVLAKTPLHSKP